MPNMFSRRRGSSANPPVDRNTTAAATTAASSAFLGRAQSQTGLSSAAAAAALRSHTTSPEPVGSIQTKRMVRRGSQTSVGSGSVIGSGTRGGVGRAGLQRNNSSGSMTERTFRSPSPGRSNGAVAAAPEAPPVPKLPTSLRGAHQRSASTEPPQRIMSPTPRGNTRGMSVDRAGNNAANASRRTIMTPLPDVDEVERQGSNGSINYSRPISGQGTSPIAAPQSKRSTGSWFTSPAGTLTDKPAPLPASATASRSQATSNVQSDIAAAANRPTKKKQISHNAQGSHLSLANESLHSSQDDGADPVMVYDPASRTFITKPRTAAGRAPEPASPVFMKPAGPKPGEYDPNTRKIVPQIPPQQPSIVVTGGQNAATRAKPNLPAVNTHLDPPPRNPARTDPSSPVSPRAAGILQKQPSVVREDPEGEQEAETSGHVKSYNRPPNGSFQPARTLVAATPTNRNRSESLDVPRSGSDSSGRNRGSSHSPSRSARFSASPIMEFTRHDPPERGISPAKSAMKHSPASSIRDGSPAVAASPIRKAMSETSDTPSLESTTKKKKKSVRVSFTEQPQHIEYPTTPNSRAQAAREVSPMIDDDMDDIMKPRPELPSFGSVRQSRLPQEVAEKVTERPPDRHEASSDHVVGGILAQNHAGKEQAEDVPAPPEVTSREGPTYSSDESEDDFVPATELDAGGASAKAVSSRVIGPPPPIAIKEEEHVPDIQISLQPPTPGEEEKTLEDAAPTELSSRSSLERFAVPGGWTAEPEEEDVPVAAPATVAALDKKSDESKKQVVLDTAAAPPVLQPETFSTVGAYTHTEPNLSDIAESDSDDSAIFSDAEEDLSYMDGTGFASIDTIVESPTVKKKKEVAPDSPTARQTARRTSKDEARPALNDWNQATSYWKQLSKQQREQIERSHMSSDDEYKPTANPLANRPKKKKSALKQPGEPTQIQSILKPAPPMQEPNQPAKTAMRKSMRGPPEPAPAAAASNGVQMRSSLREGGGGGMRSSMRDRPQSEYMASKPAQRQNARPASSGSAMPTAAAGGAMSRRPQSPEEVSQDGPFPKIKQAPQQRQQQSASQILASRLPPPPAPADDSDSESSFRKKRRPSQNNADASGKYSMSMKRSMRTGSIDSAQQRPVSPTPVPTAKERKAFSVRSLSPAGSFFGRKQLKESMRAAPADTGAKTLRGPNSMRNTNTKAPSKAPAGPRPRASTGGMANKFKSRFADSDDEDDRGQAKKPSFFSSRFADSDDDEPGSPAIITADLTPVRGIPRRQNQQDGDSTDLSDEDDYDPRKASRGRTKQTKPTVPDSADVEKAMAAARRNLGMTNGNANGTGAAAPQTTSNEGGVLSKGSLRKPEPEPQRPQSPMSETAPKRRGFMGSILRRNRTMSNSSQQIPLASPPPPLPNQANTPLASPRPGKLHRRTSAAQEQERGYFGTTNPKTQNPPAESEADANWPLTPPAKLGELRPSTSDGLSRHEQAVALARSMRPDIGRSQSNGQDAIAGGGGRQHVGFTADTKETNGNPNGAAFSSKTGKKKKFGMLRKAFGLND